MAISTTTSKFFSSLLLFGILLTIALGLPTARPELPYLHIFTKPDGCGDSTATSRLKPFLISSSIVAAAVHCQFIFSYCANSGDLSIQISLIVQLHPKLTSFDVGSGLGPIALLLLAMWLWSLIQLLVRMTGCIL